MRKCENKVHMGILSNKTSERLFGSTRNNEEKIEQVELRTLSLQPLLEPP